MWQFAFTVLMQQTQGAIEAVAHFIAQGGVQGILKTLFRKVSILYIACLSLDNT